MNPIPEQEHIHAWSRSPKLVWAGGAPTWVCDCGAIALSDNPPRPVGPSLEDVSYAAGYRAGIERAAKEAESFHDPHEGDLKIHEFIRALLDEPHQEPPK